MPKDGGGAGNNLAHGYAFGDRLYEEVMEMIDRETEGSDFGSEHQLLLRLGRSSRANL
jgi:hypothetical protein